MAVLSESTSQRDVTLNVTLRKSALYQEECPRNDRLVRPKGGRTHSSAQVWTCDVPLAAEPIR
jgi:hypothetical protein